MRGRGVVAAVTVAAFALAPPTFAGEKADKKTCVAAYEQTQRLKKEGKLLAAKEQALICAQESCPAVVHDDCANWTVQLESAIPTIVLVVTDGDGKDVTDVKVSIDGTKVADKLDGKAIPLEVGTHTLTFERGVDQKVEQTVLAREGEKNRTIKVQIGSPTKPEEPPKPEAPVSTDRPTPTATYVMGAVALVGLGVFAGFGIAGSSKKTSLDDSGCKPACSKSDVDGIKRSYLIADIGLGVGVVAAGVALVLYITRGNTEPTPAPAASALRFDVAASPQGGSAVVRFAF